jgi:proline iminopeptidase
MDIKADGVTLYCKPVGSPQNYPLIILHGGPGLDHTEMHPWLDSLADEFYLVYCDLRGQGRSQRVDPAGLSLDVFARDVSAIAAELGFSRYALLGHSYGAFVALTHAIEEGTAAQYIISSGTASFSKTEPEIEANLASFEPVELRESVTRSWALEPEARTPEDVARIMEMQMPFHFASTESEGYRRYMARGDADAVYSPGVLAYFASNSYAIEMEDRLGEIDKPALILTGALDRTCTPRAAEHLHRGIPDSDLVVVPDAGHMTFIEQPDVYFAAVRDFLHRNGAGTAGAGTENVEGAPSN